MSSKVATFYKLFIGAACFVFLVGCKHRRKQHDPETTQRKSFIPLSKKRIPRDTNDGFPHVVFIEPEDTKSHEISVIEVENDTRDEAEGVINLNKWDGRIDWEDATTETDDNSRPEGQPE